MQPRLKTSQKWTALPRELTAQMQTVVAQNFAAQLGQGEVVADGRIYPTEILITVGVKQPRALKQSHFEISIAYKTPKDNVLKLLHLGMDAAGALLEQYFTAEDDGEFPRIWTSVDFENREIFVQYTTANAELEAEADRLLGADAGDDLARGDWDDEVSPELIKAQLGIDDDET